MQSSEIEMWRNMCRVAGVKLDTPVPKYHVSIQGTQRSQRCVWYCAAHGSSIPATGRTPEEATINAAKAALGVK